MTKPPFELILQQMPGYSTLVSAEPKTAKASVRKHKHQQLSLKLVASQLQTSLPPSFQWAMKREVLPNGSLLLNYHYRNLGLHCTKELFAMLLHSDMDGSLYMPPLTVLADQISQWITASPVLKAVFPLSAIMRFGTGPHCQVANLHVGVP